MRVRSMLLVALVGAGCGSTTVDVDAAAQDATIDGAGDACEGFGCVDAFAQPDGAVAPIVCPDAGYFITVNGDGVAKTLSSGFDGLPIAQFIDCCGYTAFSIVGSESADGGASIRLEQASAESADGGLTFGASANDAYFRSDGTPFASSYVPDASPPVTTYTHVDPPGGTVAGSYAVTVATSAQPDAAALSLSGTFFVCRVDDVYCGCPPPPHP